MSTRSNPNCTHCHGSGLRHNEGGVTPCGCCFTYEVPRPPVVDPAVALERERIASELDRLADAHYGTGTDAVLMEFAKELRTYRVSLPGAHERQTSRAMRDLKAVPPVPPKESAE